MKQQYKEDKLKIVPDRDGSVYRVIAEDHPLNTTGKMILECYSVPPEGGPVNVNFLYDEDEDEVNRVTRELNVLSGEDSRNPLISSEKGLFDVIKNEHFWNSYFQNTVAA